MTENEFVRLGYGLHGINGMLIRNADDILFERNRFVDCGRADGSGGRALCFVGGEIRRFRLIDNRFESPTGRTTYAIAVQGARDGSQQHRQRQRLHLHHQSRFRLSPPEGRAPAAQVAIRCPSP